VYNVNTVLMELKVEYVAEFVIGSPNFVDVPTTDTSSDHAGFL